MRLNALVEVVDNLRRVVLQLPRRREVRLEVHVQRRSGRAGLGLDQLAVHVVLGVEDRARERAVEVHPRRVEVPHAQVATALGVDRRVELGSGGRNAPLVQAGRDTDLVGRDRRATGVGRRDRGGFGRRRRRRRRGWTAIVIVIVAATADEGRAGKSSSANRRAAEYTASAQAPPGPIVPVSHACSLTWTPVSLVWTPFAPNM